MGFNSGFKGLIVYCRRGSHIPCSTKSCIWYGNQTP